MSFENGRVVRVVLRAVPGDPKFQRANVLHYDLDDGDAGSKNDPQALADRFRDDVLPKLRNIMSDGFVVQPVVVADEVDPLNPTKPREEWQSGTAANGDRVVTGESLPKFCTTYVRLNSAFVGRRYNGRLFPPADLFEGDNFNGGLDAGIKAGIQAYLDAIPRQPDIASGTSNAQANWCIFSRTARLQQSGPYLAHVTDVTLSSVLHSMRSRNK